MRHTQNFAREAKLAQPQSRRGAAREHDPVRAAGAVALPPVRPDTPPASGAIGECPTQKSKARSISRAMGAARYVALVSLLPETTNVLSPEDGTKIAVAVYAAMKSSEGDMSDYEP